MYLLFAEENSVTGEDDADGDVAGGGGTKSSMCGEGRARSSRRRIRRDIAPHDLDGRRPVVKVGSSRVTSASQKPYSSSPGAGSQGRGFQRPALPNVGARKRRDGETTAVAQ